MSRVDDLIDELCPGGVAFRTLGDVGSIFGGLTGKSKADFSDGNARFVSYMNVFDNIAVNAAPDDFVRVGEGERQQSLRRGDILFTGTSETPDEVAMSSVVTVDPDEPLYLNSFCIGCRLTDASVLDPEFAKHLFRSSGMRRQLVRTANGVTRFNVSKARLAEVKVPIPPIEVQHEIVRILDPFTELQANLTAELEARRLQYATDLHTLLLDPRDANARWGTIGEIGRVAMCKRVFKNETTPVGEIPFFKIGTFGGTPDAFISQELYEEYKRRYSFPKKGDVLISAAGTIGRAIPYDGEPAFFQDSNIVWVDNDESRVTNRFLFYWYQVVDWSTDVGTIQRLYNDNLRRAKILIPSLSEQHRVVAILDKFDVLVNDVSTGIPAELTARREQYKFYRDRLLTFEDAAA